jgi:hypothetical protein
VRVACGPVTEALRAGRLALRGGCRWRRSLFHVDTLTAVLPRKKSSDDGARLELVAWCGRRLLRRARRILSRRIHCLPGNDGNGGDRDHQTDQGRINPAPPRSRADVLIDVRAQSGSTRSFPLWFSLGRRGVQKSSRVYYALWHEHPAERQETAFLRGGLRVLPRGPRNRESPREPGDRQKRFPGVPAWSRGGIRSMHSRRDIRYAAADHVYLLAATVTRRTVALMRAQRSS